jgi:hypothetical protein
LQDRIAIAAHFIVPEPKDRISLTIEICGSPSVSGTNRVLTTIKLDNQSGFGTQEVGEVWPHRNLARDFEPGEIAITQHIAEPVLNVRASFAQSAGALNRLCGALAVTHPTISAVSTTARSSTSVPAAAQSLVISSASLCESPSTQGHMIIAVGATRLIQQAS